MAYLYRHIRTDKNQPFYIGIGSDDNGLYERANNANKYHRNKLWNKIVAKTDFYVEIVLDNISWDEAKEKEIEFIALYKRVVDGGILSNITLGGEGMLGFSLSKESRDKISKTKMGCLPWNKGMKTPIESVEKMRRSKIGKIPYNKGVKLDEEKCLKIAIKNRVTR